MLLTSLDTFYKVLCSLDKSFIPNLFAFHNLGELGDHNPKRDPPGYASEFQFMKNQSAKLEKSAEAKHLKLKGMSQQNAEMQFLNKVKWLDMYGVDSYKVQVEKLF